MAKEVRYKELNRENMSHSDYFRQKKAKKWLDQYQYGQRKTKKQ